MTRYVSRLAASFVLMPLLALSISISSPIRAEELPDGATMDEIINVLKKANLIDDTEAERMRLKAAAERGKQKPLPDVASKLLDRMKFSADFRLRQENFWFSRDPLGTARDDRSRMRYRVRLGMEFQANDWADIVLRIASGEGRSRSTNRSIGVGDDFDPDGIFIDRAYLRAKLPELGGIKTNLNAGRIYNPFVWKRGKDFMLWDNDLNLEGISFTSKLDLSEDTQLFGNFAWLTADEESTSADPKVYAYQLGGTTSLTDGLQAGVRASLYDWHSLDTSFITRSVGTAGPPAVSGFGNQTNAFDDTQAQILELSAFLSFSLSDNLPVLLWATGAQNLDADSMMVMDPGTGAPGPVFGEEDEAFGLGLELGSSKKLAKLGVAYFEVEANSIIAQFTDSDLFDGLTNRRGWVVYGSKKLGSAVELKASLFSSEPLGRDFLGFGSPFDDSLNNSRRLRSQIDFLLKY